MKDGNNVSGTSRKSFPYYEDIDSILGNRAASCPPTLLDSGREPSVGNTNDDLDNSAIGMSMFNTKMNTKFTVLFTCFCCCHTYTGYFSNITNHNWYVRGIIVR